MDAGTLSMLSQLLSLSLCNWNSRAACQDILRYIFWLQPEYIDSGASQMSSDRGNSGFSGVLWLLPSGGVQGKGSLIIKLVLYVASNNAFCVFFVCVFLWFGTKPKILVELNLNLNLTKGDERWTVANVDCEEKICPNSHNKESAFSYDCVRVMQLCLKMRDQNRRKKDC